MSDIEKPQQQPQRPPQRPISTEIILHAASLFFSGLLIGPVTGGGYSLMSLFRLIWLSLIVPLLAWDIFCMIAYYRNRLLPGPTARLIVHILFGLGALVGIFWGLAWSILVGMSYRSRGGSYYNLYYNLGFTVILAISSVGWS